MTQKIEEAIIEFRNNIYGEEDALFDRAGNNVSRQVENWLQSKLSQFYQAGREEGERLQRMDNEINNSKVY